MDLIFTNKPEKTSEVKLTTTDSDHKLIQGTRFAKGLKTTPRYTTKRCYKSFDENQFIREVNQIRWFDAYMGEDPNIAAERLSTKINGILNKHTPVRQIQTRNHFAPWLSEENKKNNGA